MSTDRGFVFRSLTSHPSEGDAVVRPRVARNPESRASAKGPSPLRDRLRGGTSRKTTPVWTFRDRGKGLDGPLSNRLSYLTRNLSWKTFTGFSLFS